MFTFVLPNTLEDLFALAIGGLVGYSALLNLPLRRADAKEKLQRAATQFIEVRPVNRQSSRMLLLPMHSRFPDGGLFAALPAFSAYQAACDQGC